MELILTMVQAFFDQMEIDPEQISEVEMFSGVSPGEWWVHVLPEQSWFAQVYYHAGQWRVTQYEYLNL